MKIYFYIIGGGLTLIALFNIVLSFLSPWQTLAWVAIVAIACGILDGIITLIVHLLPNKYFEPKRKIFNVSQKKINFYTKLGVKKWKEKIPELGQFSNFKKNKVREPLNPIYMHKFLIENCYADILHLISAFAGFAVIFIVPKNLILSLAIPIAILNFIINYMPVIIQRYNRPKLLNIYDKLLKKIEQSPINNQLIDDNIDDMLEQN